MNKVFELVKINYLQLINSFNYNKKKKKKNKSLSFIAYFLVGTLISLLFGAFFGLGLFETLSNNFIDNADLNTVNDPSGFLMFAFIFYLFIEIVLAVVANKNILFYSKDIDFLLSLPITKNQILTSKIITILLNQVIFAISLFIPLIYIYFDKYGYSTSILINLIIACFFLLFLSTAISVFIGYLFSFILTKFNNSKAIDMLLNIIMFIVVYVLYMIMSTGLYSGFIDELKRYLFIIYDYANYIVEERYLNIIIYYVIIIFIIMISYYFISKVFFKILGDLKKKKKVIFKYYNYKFRTSKKELLFSDIKKVLSRPFLIFNNGFGILLYLIMSFIIIPTSSSLTNIEGFAVFKEIIPILLIGIVAFMLITATVTPILISLEGENIWILKTLPISYKDIVHSKIKAQLYLVLPIFLVLNSLILFSFGLYIEIIIVFLFTILIGTTYAVVGLRCNLKRPKLEWTNENAVIKQSMSMFIAMLKNIGITAIPFILYFALLSRLLPSLYALYGLIFVIVGGYLFFSYKKLMTDDKEKFLNL